LGGAWCCGAVFAPIFTTLIVRSPTPDIRLGFFAPMYLLPLAFTGGCSLSARIPVPKDSSQPANLPQLANLTLFWAMIFVLYGGIEASVANWIPMFTQRYHIGTGGAAQWSVSIFWIGLIGGRMGLAGTAASATEAKALRLAIVSAGCCLLWLVNASSSIALFAAIATTGICVGPVFPLLLSASFNSISNARSIGVVLAAAGLGGAVFPFMLGAISNASSLRIAMSLPLAGLLLLLVFALRAPGLISFQ
jgi:fucose permease